MKIFKITEKIEVICEAKKTRSGFKHEATLVKNSNTYETVKCCYLNRTWECYEYQSVLYKLIEKTTALSNEEKETCKKFINQDHTDWSGFRTVAMVSKLGDIFCDTKKDRNDWKLRMLKAGLGNMGLEMPEDWEQLDEDTKQSRLDAVIKMVGEHP
jgi:hypothetical protein